ncbi:MULTISPECIES: response regulator [unclassified Sphingomonas]|uniref:response regulator n=1 Tax=unclassified Sphingomonas TaxID=196159 RepID=UPI000E71CED4|nr:MULTISPECIES: response regulator [unclassified Sphingomonas]RKE43566.1 response regulator receiver domain-containing protein [Sphingomonas sp. PP-CC-1A-547]TCM05786.1 response regulator receiver domain-containing protein [Sphingomonas sp. PP-CC-3G-468]
MTLSTVPYALVVDDDPLIMMDTTSILEDAGFRFYEAMDGDEAKRILAANSENIVLLFSDVDMPGETNGFALARHVAENWPAIEIVIASGHVLPKPGEMPEKATFISKPFNKQMVHGHLRNMLPDSKLPEPLKKAV